MHNLPKRVKPMRSFEGIELQRELNTIEMNAASILDISE